MDEREGMKKGERIEKPVPLKALLEAVMLHITEQSVRRLGKEAAQEQALLLSRYHREFVRIEEVREKLLREMSHLEEKWQDADHRAHIRQNFEQSLDDNVRVYEETLEKFKKDLMLFRKKYNHRP